MLLVWCSSLLHQRFPGVETSSDFDPQTFLSTLTGGPGVYRMVDSAARVLYVGKARSLKRRVASYFRAPGQLEPKTRVLMSQVASVEITATHTETEALLLENSLIKEHQPRYNILLRDDKSFPYIHVSTQQTFPRLAFHRGARNRPGRYFGPFASAGATRETLNLLQKLFQVRQCEDSFFRNRSRPCLQHQIDRCTAPCVALVDGERYQEDVRHVIMFLEGKSEEMIAELVTRMESASKRLEFERAGRYRDQIASLRRVQERQHVIGAKGDVDVVASKVRDGIAVVQLTVIRNGQSLGSRTLVPRQAANSTERDVLDAFLSQYYLRACGTLQHSLRNPRERAHRFAHHARRGAPRPDRAPGHAASPRPRGEGALDRDDQTERRAGGGAASGGRIESARTLRSIAGRAGARRSPRSRRVLRHQPYRGRGAGGVLCGLRAFRAGQGRVPAIQHQGSRAGRRLRRARVGRAAPLYEDAARGGQAPGSPDGGRGEKGSSPG